MKTNDFLEILKEVQEEILKDIREEQRPNSSEVLEIYEPKNQQKFGDKDFTPIDLVNAIIDLQNHLMVANMVKVRNNCITKDEKKVLIEHLEELRMWINVYLRDAQNFLIDLIGNDINDEYANKTKDELIEELKKLKENK